MLISPPPNPKPTNSFGIERLLSWEGARPPSEVADSIERFVNQRANILETKLQIFSQEIQERLRIHQENVSSINYQSLLTYDQILTFHPTYGTGRYDRTAVSALYQERNDLAKELRQQHVECWRDVVMVMRDFLLAWEAREQAHSKSLFLQNE